ncbi:hypothetical protein YWY31_06090 [Paenibacillus illinoisensis]|uniref:hypothetical protein n=1 Tax=Paenibacillus illinoisensis TaxID=59845 RepID=UPI0034BD9CDC
MNNFNFLNTDEEVRGVVVHLISGEFYTGSCIKTSNPNVIIVETKDSKIEIPLWTIKRVKLI